jgi:hypothetical protein
VAAVAIVLLGALPAVAQTNESQTGQWTVPRTADGQPDLQGIWANNVATPLERPVAFEGKDALTDEELAELEQRITEVLDGGDAIFGDGLVAAALQENSAFLTFDETTGNYSQVWLVERDIDNRTSLITEPANGRLPALTPTTAERLVDLGAHLAAHPADSWEDRILSERCITFGVPNLFAGYNSYYQIFQTENHVAILQELIHDVRIIPLTDAPHVDDDIRQWYGDSRGHWDGDTLVVETKNFSPKSDTPVLALKALRGLGGEMHLVERFTRVGPDRLQYEVTVDNPAMWERPWTAMIPFSKSTDAIYEYACHEGNHGMEGILAGHRAEERTSVPSR